MWDILIPIIVGVVCGAGGWFGGYWYRRNIAEAKVAKAEDAVKQMIDAAQKRAETIKKETILEAKEEVYKLKSENERENRERRNEIQRSERRLLQKEELLGVHPNVNTATVWLRPAELEAYIRDCGNPMEWMTL